MGLLGLLGLLGATAHAAPQWQLRGPVATGRQFAAIGDGSVVHVVSQSYVQVDETASVLTNEADVGDEHQGPLDFYPAIAVGDDGSVHVVTRHGGSYDAGFEIRYRRRAPGGGWDPSITVGSPVGRNYVVGVGVTSAGRVLVTHGHAGVDVAATMDVYEVAGGSANSIGATPTGWLRVDNDYSIASSGNALLLASGEPGPSSPFHVAFASDANGDVIGQWQATHATHEGGAPRRGGPATHVDDDGNVHVVYGGESTVQYVRYSAAGVQQGGGVQVMDGLGTWHLSYGNGAVVSSASGSRVLVVGLQNLDGDQTAGGSELWWAESLDGGMTFGPAQALGATTDGGEGRMRPRMAMIGDTVMLLYYDPGSSSIALATAAWPGDDPGEGSTGGGGSDGGLDDSAGASEGGAPTSGGAATGTSGGAGTGALSTGIPLPPGLERDEGGCACASGRSGGHDRRGASWLALLLLGVWRRRRVNAR